MKKSFFTIITLALAATSQSALADDLHFDHASVGGLDGAYASGMVRDQSSDDGSLLSTTKADAWIEHNGQWLVRGQYITGPDDQNFGFQGPTKLDVQLGSNANALLSKSVGTEFDLSDLTNGISKNLSATFRISGGPAAGYVWANTANRQGLFLGAVGEMDATQMFTFGDSSRIVTEEDVELLASALESMTAGHHIELSAKFATSLDKSTDIEGGVVWKDYSVDAANDHVGGFEITIAK